MKVTNRCLDKVKLAHNKGHEISGHDGRLGKGDGLCARESGVSGLGLDGHVAKSGEVLVDAQRDPKGGLVCWLIKARKRSSRVCGSKLCRCHPPFVFVSERDQEWKDEMMVMVMVSGDGDGFR